MIFAHNFYYMNFMDMLFEIDFPLEFFITGDVWACMYFLDSTLSILLM